ncbi:MAG: polymer-forming cytoskeletal protein [Patescibacteria group bacterium]|nr:polymer-forming cytoskeletal protein [Patescibacteria group bacterium]
MQNGVSNGMTVIAKGVKVEGDFDSQGDVMIEGQVNGHVSTNGLLTVGNEARLKADVSAANAVIAGDLEGTVNVSGRLELKSTAKIQGDVTCETAIVEAGAALNGKFMVGQVKTPSTTRQNEAKNASKES